MMQLKRAIPSLRMPCNCGSKAHCATGENSPKRAQTVRLSDAPCRQDRQRFGHIRSGMPRFNCYYFVGYRCVADFFTLEQFFMFRPRGG